MSTPRSRLRPTHEVPSGYPRTGLVAFYDLMQDNLLLQSQTFDNASWTKSRSYVAANCAADPVTGAYTVDKLVEDGTATNSHYVQQSLAVPAGANSLLVVVKANGRPTASVVLHDGTANRVNLSVNLSTLVVTPITGTAAAVVENGFVFIRCVSTTCVAGSGYVQVLLHNGTSVTYSGLGHQQTCAAGGGTTTAKLSTCVLADDALNGSEAFFADAPTVAHTVTDWDTTSKIMTFTPARALTDGVVCTVGPGIFIARAQLNPGTTARDYVATTDMQTQASLYNLSPTLQRGPTTGAEASDGSWGASGYVAVTDDYLLGSALSGVTMAGDWTAFVVGLFNGTTGRAWSLSDNATNTRYQELVYWASGALRPVSRYDGASNAGTVDLTVPTASYCALAITNAGGTVRVRRLDTNTSVTVADADPPGTPRLGIAARATNPVSSIADAMTASLCTFHNTALSTADIQRAYRALKGRAARKGVTVL